MSLFGALNSSVTGLRAQSDALGVISDNIANVNTTGFKRNNADFASLVTGAATETSFNPGGVQIRPTLEATQQGVLDSSEISTDLAIDGNGFFSVKDSVGNVDANELLFTRAGNFRVNDNGDLQNANGFLLQGWRLTEDQNGDLVPPGDQQNPGSLETVNVQGFSGIARATQNVELGANLPPNLPVGENRQTTVRVFDAEGTPHNLQLSFTRDDGSGNALPANQYRVDIHAPTLSNDPNSPQSAMFNAPAPVDISATDNGVAARTIDGFVNAIQGQTTDGAGNIVVGGQTFQIQDGGAAQTNQTIDQTFLNGVGDLQIVAGGPDGAIGGGDDITINTGIGTAPTARSSLDQLIQATDISAVTPTDGDGDGTNDSAAFNLLNVGPRVRVTQSDAANGINDSGGANLTAAELAEVDLIEVDQNNDNSLDAANDLTLRKADNTVNDTNFQQVNRLSTVVEFNGDGSIRTIGANNANLAIGGLAEQSALGLAQVDPDNGALTLDLDFSQRTFGVGGGTDATQPQQISLNIGTPRDPDGDGANENDRLLDGLTSFENEAGFQINEIEQDGLQFGNFTGVSVGEDGIVTANFSNGERRDIFQLPVSTFANPNGLEARSGTVFAQTEDSGDILLNEAGLGAAGTVAPAAIERSTVDLATEFTKMIETQRAYSASTRVVTASDEMLQEITNATR